MIPVFELWRRAEKLALVNPKGSIRAVVAFYKREEGSHIRFLSLPASSIEIDGRRIDPAFALAIFVNNRTVGLGAEEVWLNCPEGLFREFEGYLRSRFGYLFGFMEAIYGRPFELRLRGEDEIRSLRPFRSKPLGFSPKPGGFLGVDLGRSDLKVVYAEDGALAGGLKRNWAPERFDSPERHADEIIEAVEELLGRAGVRGFKAVGLSVAGVVRGGRIKVSGLFSGVKREELHKVENFGDLLSGRLGSPVYVLHDGDAAAVQIKFEREVRGGVLGISLGSGVGAGCVNAEDGIEGLGEIGKTVLDLSDEAPVHRYLGIKGAAIFYLSQNAAFRMAEELGMRLEDESKRAEHLERIKERALGGDEGFEEIPIRMGEFIALSLPEILDIYSDADIRLVELYGRAVSGRFGEIVLESALKTLRDLYPEVASEVRVERGGMAELGQALAAARYASLLA